MGLAKQRDRSYRRRVFIYGTAWKEERTEALAGAALAAGFRAIDTANQRKHYDEAAVGRAIAASGIARDALFVQTKYTFARGQDHRLPYERGAPIARQVEQSFASSLAHLGVAALDSYLLHGPTTGTGLVADDVAAWGALEAIHAAGGARAIGISNVTAAQLTTLLDTARVPPTVVQNRCYANAGWDADVRAVCRARGVTYQGFSLLTANRREMLRPMIDEVMLRTGLTREQLVFRFALDVGIVPLTGTSSEAHLLEDLGVEALPPLAPADRAVVERIATA